MFTPVKAIVAGALTLTLLGVLSIAQPFDQQGATVPAAATAEPSPPPAELVKVTGTNTCDYTDFPLIHCTEKASDPRVSGPATRTITLTPDTTEQGALMWNDVTITGPEGTWSGEGYGVMQQDQVIHVVELSAGNGAYEGLIYATWQTVGPDGDAAFAGLIQPGSLPPGFPVVPLPEPSPASE